ncbi:MAG: hypothetical protein E7384_01000 [Ruminococcaceae bacterium]|nr:hypothetical protein [Oscillospiraceae bacterium]
MKKFLLLMLVTVLLLSVTSTTTVFASMVMIVDVDGITLPLAGNKPDFTATLGNNSGTHKITLVKWTEYDEGWEWQKDMTDTDTFKEGYWYVVSVYLETTSGNTFGNSVTGTINNTSAKMSGNSVQANGTKVCFYTSYQATKMPDAIGKVDLTVVRPYVGKTPTFAKVDTDQYVSEKYGTVSNCSNGVTWTNQSSGINLTSSNPFKEGVKYKVSYYLTAKDGYKFDKNTKATINGATATVTLTDHYHAIVSLGDLTPGDKTAISNVALTVVKPIIGKTPTFAKVDTAQYVSEKYGTVSNCSNGVTWTNQSSGVNLTVSNPFKEGVKYKVSYYLTAKDGYKFTTGTNCTINGVAASIAVTDSTHAIISLNDLVPGDGKEEIATLELNVTAPKNGEKPTYTKIEGTGYYSDNGLNGTSTKVYKNGIAWYKTTSSYISPGTTETFIGGSEYTVKIALTPNDGYKFSKLLTAKINGKTATVEAFDDGSINVWVKFTALNKDHKHTESSWQNDTANHWKVCTDCGTITMAKEAHKDQNKDNKCDVCSYAIPQNVNPTTSPSGDTQEPVNSSVPTETNNPPATQAPADEPKATEDTADKGNNDKKDDSKNDKKNNGALIWIIIGAVAVLAAGGVIVFVVLKKKKAK